MKTLRSARALLAGTFLVMTATGLLNTLLAVRLELAGGTASATGAIQAAYFVGLMAGARHGHRVVRRVGHSRAYTAFAGAATAAGLGHALLESAPLWALLRVLVGFNVAGLLVVTESWLNELTERRGRGRLLALYTMAAQLGVANGQLAFGLGDPRRLEGFVLAGMAFALALVPVALSRARAPERVEVSALRLRTLVRSAPVGVLSCVLSGVLIGALYGVGPVYAARSGLDADGVARFMGILVVSGVVLPWPIGWLADRFDRTLVTLAVAVGLAALCVLLALAVEPSFTRLAILSFLLGGAVFAVYPLGVAQANDYVEPPDRLAAAGALLLAYGVGSTLGPGLAGIAMTALGPGGLFVVMGLAATGFALFAAVSRLRYPPLPSDEQSPWVVVPRTTPVAAQLDPRVEVERPGEDDAAA